MIIIHYHWLAPVSITQQITQMGLLNILNMGLQNTHIRHHSQILQLSHYLAGMLKIVSITFNSFQASVLDMRAEEAISNVCKQALHNQFPVPEKQYNSLIS